MRGWPFWTPPIRTIIFIQIKTRHWLGSLPPPFSPNVNSWFAYNSMRIEFVVRTYVNENQIDSETYLWLFDGEEESWIPRGNNFHDVKTVSQTSEGDIIKIEHYNKSVSVKILKIPEGNISVQEAASLYEEIK